MKLATILLAALVIVLGVVSLQQRRTARDQLTAVQEQLTAAQEQLTAAQEQLTALKTEKAQLVQQGATLVAVKTSGTGQSPQAQPQPVACRQELAAANQIIEEQKSQLATTTNEKKKLTEDLARLHDAHR